MTSEQATTVGMRDEVGQQWLLTLSLASDGGLRICKDDQLLGEMPAQVIVNSAARHEFAEDHATALLTQLTLSMGFYVPAGICDEFHAVLSRWLWEHAPFDG